MIEDIARVRASFPSLFAHLGSLRLLQTARVLSSFRLPAWAHEVQWNLILAIEMTKTRDTYYSNGFGKSLKLKGDSVEKVASSSLEAFFIISMP